MPDRYTGMDAMQKPLSRREILKGVTSTGALAAPFVARAQQKPLELAGRPVEAAITAVSPRTVRITLA